MKVAIITEGFQGIGYGHLTRCLSLYQAFKEKNINPLVLANCDEEGKNYLVNANVEQLNWLDAPDILLDKITGFDIAVIDSYLAPLKMYKDIHNSVKRVVYIDDYIRLDYPPGMIVNGTLGAENLSYDNSGIYSLLLGIKYIPLRKEFWDVENFNKKSGKLENILITLGGQDYRNLTTQLLSFLIKKYPDLEYQVVIGKLPENFIDKKNIHFFSEISADEMLNLMLKADLAISAAGQTTYELARVGTQTIAIGVAENQRFNIKGWLQEKYIKNEIWYNDDNLFEKISSDIPLVPKNMIRPLVDGQGARRIIASATA